MAAWYFTFGYSSPHRKRYVRIEADNFLTAREAMIHVCGTGWSREYCEQDFACHIKRWHLTQIAIMDVDTKSSYRLVRLDGSTVWIEDENKPGKRSVTNDAERVVAELYKAYGERRFIYKDSAGDWDELKHRGAAFVGFAPARELAL